MLDIDLQLFKNEVHLLTEMRNYEILVREVANGDINGLIDQLIPNTSTTWKQRNSDTTNHFAAFLDKIRDAITTGEISWDYQGQSDAVDDEIERFLRARTDMVGDMVMDILIGGRFVLFPYMSERTKQIELSVLSGWCYFMVDPDNSNLIEAVVQVKTGYDGSQLKYFVNVYTRNKLTVYPALTDWTKWTVAPPSQEFDLTYADGLPCIPVVVRRGADRIPQGIATMALPGFKRYLKDAITYNAASEMYGRPETLVASDFYLREAQDAPESKLIKNLREKGPAALKIINQEDRYENLPPVDLSPLQQKQDNALSDLANSLKVPNIASRELSGLALQEIRTSFTHTVNSYADAISQAMKQAVEIASRIKGSKLPTGVSIDLKPQFSQDIAQERDTVISAYDKGAINRSQALTMLQQLGMSGITDEAINDEIAIEAKEYQDRLAGGNGGQAEKQAPQDRAAANGSQSQAIDVKASKEQPKGGQP